MWTCLNWVERCKAIFKYQHWDLCRTLKTELVWHRNWLNTRFFACSLFLLIFIYKQGASQQSEVWRGSRWTDSNCLAMGLERQAGGERELKLKRSRISLFVSCKAVTFVKIVLVSLTRLWNFVIIATLLVIFLDLHLICWEWPMFHFRKNRELGEWTVTEFVVEEEGEIFIPEEKDDTWMLASTRTAPYFWG